MKKYETVVIVIRETADDIIMSSNQTTPQPLSGSIFTTNG